MIMEYDNAAVAERHRKILRAISYLNRGEHPAHKPQ
jgi:uncharacterized protein (DUF2249 family)